MICQSTNQPANQPSTQQGERNMTTNQTPIPEPTSLASVVAGKYRGKAAVATKMSRHYVHPWLLSGENGSFISWCDWTDLCAWLTDIRVVPVAEEAAKPEPGPWLRGDELQAVMPTLDAGDVVEVDYDGHTATGELWAHSPSGLSLWSSIVRTSDGNPGPYVDALRIIERAPEPEPEPGADIPDEVVDAAFDRLVAHDGDAWGLAQSDKRRLRLALAAADAKRAELEGGEQA